MSFGWLLTAVLVASGGEPAEITLTAERVLHDGRADRSIAEGTAHLETDGAAVDADRIVYEKATGLVVAIGHVVARLAQDGTPTSIVADLVQFRLEGERVVEVHVLDGVAYARGGANVPLLLAAKTPEALDAAGKASMRLSGNHFLRTEEGGWRLEQLELTPCDCDVTSPGWSIKTSQAVLNKDADRVAVLLPTFWFKKVPKVNEVPFFALPWLSLPLGDRATGLLFPKPGYTVLNGFSIEQPVFVTAGRSADFTFTPGFFFGGPQDWERLGVLDRTQLTRAFRVPWRGGDADAVPDPFLQPFGIQGPRLLTEFRYVPSERAQGRISVGLLYDLRLRRDPGNPTLAVNLPRGLRGEASLFHLQDFGGGFGTRVDLSAYSDGYLNRDLVPDVIAREAGYLRSTAVLFHRGPDHLVTLDTVLRQDLTSGYDLFGRDLFPRGSVAPRFGANPIQRLPALSFTLPLRPVWGPLAADFSADVVQQLPLRSGTGDEGVLANEGRGFDPFLGQELPAECLVERFYLARGANQLPQCPPTSTAFKRGLGDGVWQPGEREPRLRLNAMPRLVVGGAVADAVSLSTSAAWRQGLWFGQTSGRVITRGYPLLAARAELELARVFDGRLRHAVTPVLELRAVPFVVASANRPFDASLLGGPAPYDELDRSISDNRPRVQAVAELRNRLVERGGRELLRLDLGQGFDLLSPVTPGPGGVLVADSGGFNRVRLAESFARVGLSLGWFSVTGQGRVDPTWRKTADAPVAPRFTRGTVTFSADFPGGHGLSASYDNVLDDGTNRARAPVDLLFGDPVVSTAESRAQLLTAGARTKLGPVSLRYDLLLTNRRWSLLDLGVDDPLSRFSNRAPPSVGGITPTPVPISELLSFAQQSVGVSWTPACDCFRLDLSVVQRLTPVGVLGPIEFAGINFSVNRLGSIGTQ